MSKTTSAAAFFFMALVAGFLQNCVQPPDYPKEPVIEFLSISPNVMLQRPFYVLPDSVTTTVTFSYTDGDGDLGYPGNDTATSIIVRDARTPQLTRQYQLPYVDEQGAGNGISGEVSLNIPIVCCIPDPLNGIPLPPCDTLSPSMQMRDTVVFIIQIKDRAGHFSNSIETAPLILICRR